LSPVDNRVLGEVASVTIVSRKSRSPFAIRALSPRSFDTVPAGRRRISFAPKEERSRIPAKTAFFVAPFCQYLHRVQTLRGPPENCLRALRPPRPRDWRDEAFDGRRGAGAPSPWPLPRAAPEEGPWWEWTECDGPSPRAGSTSVFTFTTSSRPALRSAHLGDLRGHRAAGGRTRAPRSRPARAGSTRTTLRRALLPGRRPPARTAGGSVVPQGAATGPARSAGSIEFRFFLPHEGAGSNHSFSHGEAPSSRCRETVGRPPADSWISAPPRRRPWRWRTPPRPR